MAQSQAQFIADAAHQLRTPLAILKTQAEFAQRQQAARHSEAGARGGWRSGGRHRHATGAGRAADQPATGAGAGAGTPEREGGEPAEVVAEIDAVTVAEQVALDYLPLARGKQQDFGWERPAGLTLPVRADAALLREALANLVHNAIQYSGRGSRITLSAARVGSDALLVVEDDGPGIPEAEREKVFARFYRPLRKTPSRDQGSASPSRGRWPHASAAPWCCAKACRAGGRGRS